MSLETLTGWTAWLLNPYSGTVLFVIALGYIVRAVPAISNRYIPLIGMALGSVVFVIISPLTIKIDPEHSWQWYVLLWMVGVILSAAAWMIHLVFITKAEDWLRTKSPALDQWFKKTSDDAPPKV